VIVLTIWSVAHWAPGVTASVCVIVTVLQVDETVAVPVAAGLVSPPHCTLTLVGQTRVRRALAVTFTVMVLASLSTLFTVPFITFPVSLAPFFTACSASCP
jgi:hypothetical protein